MVTNGGDDCGDDGGDQRCFGELVGGYDGMLWGAVDWRCLWRWPLATMMMYFTVYHPFSLSVVVVVIIIAIIIIVDRSTAPGRAAQRLHQRGSSSDRHFGQRLCGRP
jgi:hypothetical protein